MQASKISTDYYGKGGSIMPVFSFGRLPLMPSVLTGDGSHMNLWISVVLHVVALALTITANALFFSDANDSTKRLYIGWAIFSMLLFILAVAGTVVSTALIRDSFSMPLLNTFLGGCFLGSLVATIKISYLHGALLSSDSGENITYNLAIAAQVFAIASVISNGACALSKKGGI